MEKKEFMKKIEKSDLSRLTVTQLDELRFIVMNENPASPLIQKITDEINRKLYG